MVPPGTRSDLDILIIGSGLLGTSAGLALTAAGARVTLVDRDVEARSAAVAMGAGLAGPPSVEPDVVLVAVPPSVTAAVAVEALTTYPTATVTDVASVKAPILDALREDGADLGRFVGGHPMAGREVSGAQAGRVDLFEGRPWVLTPTADTEPDRVHTVAGLVDATGAVMRVLAPEVHDKAVALTSHAPQVVSSLMAARLAGADDEMVSVSGQGLRDVVRIAASDPKLWSDILATNAVAVVPVLTSLQEDLEELSSALIEVGPKPTRSAGEPDPVAAILARGNAGADRLPAKHGGEAAAYVVVPVIVDDAPGALGRLFLAAGEAQINLEDVRIEHTVGRLTAIAHLSVLPNAAGELRQALGRGGWRVTG